MAEKQNDGGSDGAVFRTGAKSGKRLLRISLVIAVAFLAIGVALGLTVAHSQSAGDRASLADAKTQLARLQTALSQSEERNWTYYREIQSSPSITAATSPSAPGSYGDGVYLVGKTIPAGTYDGTITGEVGYWARLKNTTGFVDGIIANGLPGGPFVLTIYPTDIAVELKGVRLTAR